MKKVGSVGFENRAMPERQQIEAQFNGLAGTATVSHTPVPGSLSPSTSNEVAVKVAVRVSHYLFIIIT